MDDVFLDQAVESLIKLFCSEESVKMNISGSCW
jgi:hypothetical protein